MWVVPLNAMTPRSFSRDRNEPLSQLCNSFAHCLLLEGLFYLCHVWAVSGPLIKGEVLVNSNKPQDLSSWCLKIEMRVRHIELPHETRLENVSSHLLHVVRLDFQPDRSRSPQELALIRDIPIEKHDVEVVSQAKEVPIVLFFRDCSAEHIAIKL